MLFQINCQITVAIYPSNIDTGNASLSLNTSYETTNNKPPTTASLTTTSSTTTTTNQTTTLMPAPATTVKTQSQPTSHVKLAVNKQADIITIITQSKTSLKPIISKDNLDSLQAPNKETMYQVKTIEPRSQYPNQSQPSHFRSQLPKKLKGKQPSIKIQLLLSPRKSVRKKIPSQLPLKPSKQKGRKKPQQKKTHRQTKQRGRLNPQLNKKTSHNKNTQHKRKLQRKRQRSYVQRQPKVKQATIPRRKLSSRRQSPNRMGQVLGPKYTKPTTTSES